MSANFNIQPRLSPAGVTTAAVLVMIIAMGISTLLPSESPLTGDFATSSSSQVAQAHHQTPARKS
jgi:hypothetical protein